MRSKALARVSMFLMLGVATTVGLSPGAAAAPRPGSDETPDPSFLVVPNVGQFDPAARYQARANGTNLWVTDAGLWITLLEATSAPHPPDRRDAPVGKTGGHRRGVNLLLTFPGHSQGVALIPSVPRPTRMSYFRGSDPSRWRSAVPTYGALTWTGLYPGISLTLREVKGEPALVLSGSPGADLGAFRLRVAGADVQTTVDGGLLATTAVGPVALPAVVGDRGPLAPRVRGSEVSFGPDGAASWPASSPPNAAEPTGRGLSYGTFLGGSDVEYLYDVALGEDGSRYMVGWTFSPDFPTTPGAFDTTYDGVAGDAFVSKLDPTGSELVYSTFLGGKDTDYGERIAVEAGGAAFVAGYTPSDDFPTTPGAFDTSNEGSDGFVTKLTPDGSDLIYSTFLGGSSSEILQDMAVRDDGSLFVAGDTLSQDFPTTPGAFDRTLNNDGTGGYKDAFVSALNPTGSDLVYSTYLGGRYNDYGWGVAVGPDGTAYVTGRSQSGDFPTTPGAFDRTFNGGNTDVFVAHLDATGGSLAFSTYLGGGDGEDGEAIAVDPAGNVFVVGDTSSPDFPTTPGAYDTTINSVIDPDAFAAKLNPTGGALLYSTFLGGNDVDSALDLSVDRDGTLTATGFTHSTNFPTTPGAFDRALGGSADAFVARFDPTGSTLLYGTYLGGTDRTVDEGFALAPAGPGRFAVAGLTGSADFPVTSGAYDSTLDGNTDGFLVILQVARTMHVDRIVPRYRQFGSRYQVGAGIRILYSDGSAVEEASVTVRLDHPHGTHEVMTRPTGAQGIAFAVRSVSDSGTYTFTVLNVSRSDSVYDPSQNAETSDSVTIP